jgi:hypothetical protein
MVIISLGILCCFFVLVTNTTSADFSYRVGSLIRSDYNLALSGWVEHVKPVTTQKKYKYATYTHYNYQSGKRFFRLTTVELQNGDIMYFAQNSVTSQANRVMLRITAKETKPTRIHTFLGGKSPAWKQIYQLPDSLEAATYVDGKKLFYRIGKAEAYRPLTYTVLEEQPYYAPSVQVRQEKYPQYEVVLPADSTIMSTTWGILSGQPLINWDEPKSYHKALEIEFDQNKKLGLDGAYSIIPDNYEPRAELAFYRNPANGEGLRATEFVSYPAMGSLFADIATHLAYAAVTTQNREGYWPTYPRSGWLHKEYNIGHAYMDNRRNADNAVFLLRFVQQKPDPDIQNALRKWDHYLLQYIHSHNQKVKECTISFIPDYVGDEDGKRSHTSLNHLAANMNYLLEAYLYTKDKQKKQAAQALLAAIEITKKRWVRPDSNFYYALRPDFSPYPAEDYYQLTRDDLLHSQILLILLCGQRSNDLQYLIKHKEKWMQAQKK